MSTMREEFEAVFRESFKSDADFAGDEWSYHDLSVDNAWDLWCAAYAAGQRAATEQAAKVAEDWYFGDPGEVNHSIAVAIRARDKEQS